MLRLLLPLVLCAAPAGAAERPLLAYDVMLPEITVTAKGYESKSLETPLSVDLLRAEEVRGSVYPTPGDLLRGRPGVAVQSDGGWGMNPVIRALKKEQIVVMVDGIRINSAQPNGAIASFVDLEALDRVEVVRHPVSMLYGSGAMGGAVNLITKPVRFTQAPSFGAEVTGAASSVNDGLRGGLELTVSDRRHSIRAGASAVSVNDYEDRRGTVRYTGYRRRAGHLKYAFKLADGGVLSFQGQQQTDTDVWYPGSRKYGNAFLQNVVAHSPIQDRSLAAASWEKRLDAGWEPLLRTRFYVQNVHRTMSVYSEGLERDYVDSQIGFRTYGGAQTVKLSPAEGHTVLAGVDGWRMDSDPRRVMCTGPPAFTSCARSDPFENGRIRSVGAFVQDETSLERLSLRFGARFDSVTGDADSMGTGASLRTTGLTNTDNVASWTAGGIYRVRDLLRPYLNASMGFRAADMRERFESAVRSDGYTHNGNPGVKPERNMTLEAGLKGGDESTRYSAALYGTRIRDYIAGRVSGAATKNTENLTRVEIFGVELSFERRLLEHDVFFVMGSFQRGQNREDGEPLTEVPPGEIGFGLRHAQEYGPQGSFRVRAVDGQNRVASVFSNYTENTSPGFLTADLSAAWRFGRPGILKGSELRVSVANLMDRTYREHLTAGVSGSEIHAPRRNVSLLWRLVF